MDGFETREHDLGVRGHRRPGPGAADGLVEVRRAYGHELSEIAALFAPALELYRGAGSDSLLDAYLADLVSVRPRFDESEVLVAARDGRIVGTIAFYADVRLEGWSNLPAGWAGFRALVVHPRARGCGIGGTLVQRCIERTRGVGAKTLGIHSISLLADAIRLYERLGFARCPEFDLRAADIFPSEEADGQVALAFRLDAGRRSGRACRQAIGPRTVTEPGSTA